MASKRQRVASSPSSASKASDQGAVLVDGLPLGKGALPTVLSHQVLEYLPSDEYVPLCTVSKTTCRTVLHFVRHGLRCVQLPPCRVAGRDTLRFLCRHARHLRHVQVNFDSAVSPLLIQVIGHNQASLRRVDILGVARASLPPGVLASLASCPHLENLDASMFDIRRPVVQDGLRQLFKTAATRLSRLRFPKKTPDDLVLAALDAGLPLAELVLDRGLQETKNAKDLIARLPRAADTLSKLQLRWTRLEPAAPSIDTVNQLADIWPRLTQLSELTLVDWPRGRDRRQPLPGPVKLVPWRLPSVTKLVLGRALDGHVYPRRAVLPDIVGPKLRVLQVRVALPELLRMMLAAPLLTTVSHLGRTRRRDLDRHRDLLVEEQALAYLQQGGWPDMAEFDQLEDRADRFTLFAPLPGRWIEHVSHWTQLNYLHVALQRDSSPASVARLLRSLGTSIVTCCILYQRQPAAPSLQTGPAGGGAGATEAKVGLEDQDTGLQDTEDKDGDAGPIVVIDLLSLELQLASDACFARLCLAGLRSLWLEGPGVAIADLGRVLSTSCPGLTMLRLIDCCHVRLGSASRGDLVLPRLHRVELRGLPDWDTGHVLCLLRACRRTLTDLELCARAPVAALVFLSLPVTVPLLRSLVIKTADEHAVLDLDAKDVRLVLQGLPQLSVPHVHGLAAEARAVLAAHTIHE